MVFQTRQELGLFLKSLTKIGEGSQGVCFTDVNHQKAYKLFFDFNDEVYEKEHLLQFKKIRNSTFIFPIDVIILDGRIIGYIAKYVNAVNLFQINPFDVSLDKIEKLIAIAIDDIRQVSNQSLYCFDMMYNIMLGRKIYIVDTAESQFREDMDRQVLYKENIRVFNLEWMYFLVDTLFSRVVEQNKELLEMYSSHGQDMDILEFIKLFRSYLSELVGKEIKRLREAKMYMDQDNQEPRYCRELILK